MRKNYESELLNVIRTVVCGENGGAMDGAFDCLSSDERTALMRLAYRHQITHLVAYALYMKESMARAQGFFESLAFTTQQMAAAEEISAALSARRLQHLLLKGSVMRRLYPEAWMRNGCDVDILVKKEELDAAGEVLEELGFEKQGVVTVHDVGYLRDEIRIELHYLLIEDYRIPTAYEVLRHVWELAKPSEDNAYAFEMPDELFYFYHVAHMAKHFGDGGCGIRAVLDLWILNHRCSFDRQARELLLERGALIAFEKKMLNLAEYWFGNGSAEGLDFIEQYVLSGGAYGASENGRAVSMVRKGRLGYIWSRLFMPYSELARKYPTLEKYPFLLPFYEVRRWLFALGKKRGEYASELRDGLRSTEEKKNVDKMLDTLGLSEFR